MLYILFVAILFTIFYADTSVISHLLNDAQTKLTLSLLAPFLEPAQLQGNQIIINPHYKIIITQACNGMIPILFLWASILAYPANFRHKTLWMVLGYLLFSLINVFRILMVVYFVEQQGGQTNFHWSHDLLGNALLISVGLGVFIAFIKTSKPKRL